MHIFSFVVKGVVCEGSGQEYYFPLELNPIIIILCSAMLQDSHLQRGCFHSKKISAR